MHCMLLQEDGKETEQQLLKLKLELKKNELLKLHSKRKAAASTLACVHTTSLQMRKVMETAENQLYS